MKKLLSPRQVAQAIGVSESSVKRWADRGRIETVRTAGGHRRFSVAAVVRFLRSERLPMVRPELLGLPSNTGQGAAVLPRAAGRVFDALVAGDEALCRQVVFDLYLAGQALVEIFDVAVAPAFHRIGEQWECGSLDVYVERRACEIALRVIHEVRGILPEPTPGAPTAIGGTAESDPYQLPTTMIEAILRDAGWNAASLGSSLPFATLIDAIRQIRPALFWLSVSHVPDPEAFLRQYATLHEAALRQGTAVAVGGAALSGHLRRRMQYAAHGDNLQHLVSFVAVLRPQLTGGGHVHSSERQRPSQPDGRVELPAERKGPF